MHGKAGRQRNNHRDSKAERKSGREADSGVKRQPGRATGAEMAGRRNCGSKHVARHRHAGSHADQRQSDS